MEAASSRFEVDHNVLNCSDDLLEVSNSSTGVQSQATQVNIKNECVDQSCLAKMRRDRLMMISVGTQTDGSNAVSDMSTQAYPYVDTCGHEDEDEFSSSQETIYPCEVWNQFLHKNRNCHH